MRWPWNENGRSKMGRRWAKTVFLAAKAVGRSVLRATTMPVLLLVPLGILASCATRERPKDVAVSGNHAGALRAGAGTCAHAGRLLHAAARPGGRVDLDPCRRRGSRATGCDSCRDGWRRAEARSAGLRAAIEAALTGCRAGDPGVRYRPAALTAPIDSGFAGYREAGEWLRAQRLAGERVIDPKGLALFYANETGYTFARLTDGAHDPNVRWLVAHDAFLHGPWDYCKLLRELVGDRRPAQVFPARPTRGTSRVYVFDLARPGDETAAAVPKGSVPANTRQ